MQRTYSIELIGFGAADKAVIQAALALSLDRAMRYVEHLDIDRRADLFLANADELSALVALSGKAPDTMHPAVLIGADSQGLDWPRIVRPIRWLDLFETLDSCLNRAVIQRSVAQTATPTSWPHVDRRRRPRLDMDLTAPAEYLDMRSALNSTSAGVLGPVTVLPEWLTPAPVESAVNSPAPWPAPAAARALVVGECSEAKEAFLLQCADAALVVDEAESGLKALDLLERHAYRWMIADRHLADMDVFELCRRAAMQLHAPSPVIVIVGGDDGRVERMRASLSGCTSLLVGPVTQGHLQSVLRPERRGVSL